MKTILVTGGTGKIGKYILENIDKNIFDIHLITRRNISIKDMNTHNCNLLDDGICQKLISEIKPTHLLHLAWITAHDNFWNSEENIIWENKSKILLKEFAENGGEKAVIAGTCAEYDWNSKSYIEGKTDLKPDSLYGKSKSSLFKYTKKLCEKYNLKYSWGRIFFLYSNHDNPNKLIPFVTKNLFEKKIPEIKSNCNLIRDFIHVEDIASIFLLLLHSDFEGPINIGTGKGLSIKEIINKIANKLNFKSTCELNKKLNYTNEIKYPYVAADITKLKNELRWVEPKDFDTRLDELINYWIQNKYI